MKILLVFISFLFLGSSNVLHQDTILKIDKHGNLLGLPKKYSPAKFDLAAKKLRIKDKEVVFPECVSKYFDRSFHSKVVLSASWYHETRFLPYYLNFRIGEDNAKGYTILINLETLELIYVNKHLVIRDTIQDSEVDLGQQCSAAYRSAIKTVY